MLIPIKKIILENDLKHSPIRAGIIAGGLTALVTTPGAIYGDVLSSGTDDTYKYIPLAAGGTIGSIVAMNKNRLNQKMKKGYKNDNTN